MFEQGGREEEGEDTGPGKVLIFYLENKDVFRFPSLCTVYPFLTPCIVFIPHIYITDPCPTKSSLHLRLTPTSFPTSTHHPPPFLPLNPTSHTHLLIHHKTPNNTHPTPMSRQIFIKLIRDPIYLPQSTPRHGREIVMLVVQSHVVG